MAIRTPVWVAAVMWVAAVGAPAIAAPPDQCVILRTPRRLLAGTSFREPLPGGLEFRLTFRSGVWFIALGPVEDHALDYVWVASPPVRGAAHRMIGPGYGLTASESADVPRDLRFVVTRADYASLRASLEPDPAGVTLERMEALGRGRLSVVITDYELSAVTSGEGDGRDGFKWITFEAEVCVPGPGVAGHVGTVAEVAR